MSKAMILRYLEEIAGKLVNLRVTVEELPEAREEIASGQLTNPESENTMLDQLQTIRFVDKQRLRLLVVQTFAEMGIRGEPIGAEKVQEMITACGVKPEDNVFSRGIIDMREE